MTDILMGIPWTDVPGPHPQRGIGIVAPYDFGLDREIWRWVPDEVSLHITRTPRLLVTVTVPMAERVSEPGVVQQATEGVLAVEPDVVAYLCTAGSFVRGVAGERMLRRAMLDAGAPQAVTTSGALLEALRRLGIARLAVATPYIDSVSERLHDYLDQAGVTVVGNAHLGMDGRIWQLPYQQVIDLVRVADAPSAEAVFVSCTNTPTYDLIPALEERLGKPVLTANQVTLWAALHSIGLSAPSLDQLLFRRTAIPSGRVA